MGLFMQHHCIYPSPTLHYTSLPLPFVFSVIFSFFFFLLASTSGLDLDSECSLALLALASSAPRKPFKVLSSRATDRHLIDSPCHEH